MVRVRDEELGQSVLELRKYITLIGFCELTPLYVWGGVQCRCDVCGCVSIVWVYACGVIAFG